MRLKNFLFLFLVFIPLLNVEGLKPKSRYFATPADADNYLTMRYNRGCDYFNQESWRSAASEFEKVVFYFPDTEEAQKASYYLAVSYYNMGEFDFSNAEFSAYIKTSAPEFFEEAVYYKFCIAEHFKGGKKRRPFKMRYLPKWLSGQDSALEIYDEVIAAMPNHSLAVQALYAKAELLVKMGEIREGIDTYRLLIRRFPKDPLVPSCYLKMGEAYVAQAEKEPQNPDIIGLAELNARRYRDEYPRDEQVVLAEECVQLIKELHGQGFCETALFYERKGRPEAAKIYYQCVVDQFPGTVAASFAASRITNDK